MLTGCSNVSVLDWLRALLSVRSPAAASASCWVYGSSFSSRNLANFSDLRTPVPTKSLPSLVVFAFCMHSESMLALKPFRTMCAIELA